MFTVTSAGLVRGLFTFISLFSAGNFPENFLEISGKDSKIGNLFRRVASRFGLGGKSGEKNGKRAGLCMAKGGKGVGLPLFLQDRPR
jgi:hypothetical protein